MNTSTSILFVSLTLAACDPYPGDGPTYDPPPIASISGGDSGEGDDEGDDGADDGADDGGGAPEDDPSMPMCDRLGLQLGMDLVPVFEQYSVPSNTEVHEVTISRTDNGFEWDSVPNEGQPAWSELEPDYEPWMGLGASGHYEFHVPAGNDYVAWIGVSKGIVWWIDAVSQDANSGRASDITMGIPGFAEGKIVAWTGVDAGFHTASTWGSPVRLVGVASSILGAAVSGGSTPTKMESVQADGWGFVPNQGLCTTAP